jgi:hypothetical protein
MHGPFPGCNKKPKSSLINIIVPIPAVDRPLGVNTSRIGPVHP